GGAVELQRYGGIQRVRLAIVWCERSPAGRRSPSSWQVLAGHSHLGRAPSQLHIAVGGGLGIILGGAAAITTLEIGLGEDRERRRTEVGGGCRLRCGGGGA